MNQYKCIFLFTFFNFFLCWTLAAVTSFIPHTRNLAFFGGGGGTQNMYGLYKMIQVEVDKIVETGFGKINMDSAANTM